MKFLITGGTGFVGSFLTQQLLQNKHEVTVIGRSSAPVVRSGHFHAISADTTRKGSWQNALKDVDAVVNLAGMSIFQRWTPAYKQQIYDSRILTTRHVVEGMPGDQSQTLISTSAVGYYGSRGDDILTEVEPCGRDFLSRVGKDWEHEAFEAEKKNVRVVVARFGVVLGRSGGALKQMLTPFKWVVGGPMGSGRQWFSWIHIADLLAGLMFMLENPKLQGPVNLCSPVPVTSGELARTLGAVLGRPAVIPAPSIALRLFLGEFAETLLASQRAIPEKLLKSGFVFRFPDLKDALTDLSQSQFS
ncbi:MAG: TIGR01777 family oxidoreductase [Deltaproteobacteria bacterium]|nr:TIGR01777 family oxidoreductase [Deltaproteobacteria bacterium]